jgi:hypothetical protein
VKWRARNVGVFTYFDHCAMLTARIRHKRRNTLLISILTHEKHLRSPETGSQILLLVEATALRNQPHEPAARVAESSTPLAALVKLQISYMLVSLSRSCFSNKTVKEAAYYDETAKGMQKLIRDRSRAGLGFIF